MARTAAIAAVALLLAIVAAPAIAFQTESTWTDARATFYGRDAWSVHTGSCGYGFICPGRWSGQLAQGYDVTAVSDKSDLYGHCGECLEVKCRSASFTDGFGEKLDRSGVCLNDKSVKVKIVDTCPCNYPDNAESNARWCCGDMPHLDLSQWALEKIASDPDRWGVFAIKYRKVSCDLNLGSDEAPAVLADPTTEDPHLNLKGNTDCSAQQYDASSNPPASQQRSASGGSSKYPPGYWSQWWDNFRANASEADKKRTYKQIWDDIRAGKLTRDGHAKP